MNKERRVALKENNSRIDFVVEQLKVYRDVVEKIQDEENDCFDNLPEGFQESMKGQNMQDAIDEMEDACDEIDNIIEKLSEIKSNLSIL